MKGTNWDKRLHAAVPYDGPAPRRRRKTSGDALIGEFSELEGERGPPPDLAASVYAFHADTKEGSVNDMDDTGPDGLRDSTMSQNLGIHALWMCL